MNYVTLILGGLAAYLLLSGKKKNVLELLKPYIQLDYFITPFNPGVVQYGTLVLTNSSDKAIEIESLSLTPAQRQFTQSSNSAITKNDWEGVLSATLSYANKYFGSTIDDAGILRMPPHTSLTLNISITSVKYAPTGSPLVVTDDFEAYPFDAWFDLDVKTNEGSYRASIAAPYSNVKQ